jgi:uncharacterized iron-regulated membrane protein
VFVVCVTGAALVFRLDLQKAAHPHLFTPLGIGAPTEPAAVMETVRDAYPDGRLSGIDAPTDVRPTYLAYVNDGGAFRTVLIDPFTGRVLGELPDRSWVRTLQELHFDLLGGRTGRVVNGVGGVLLLALCLTGLVIWWPGIASWRRAFVIDSHRGWRRMTWDLHSATGIWTGALVAMWALTGVYFAFPSQFRAVVHAISPLTIVRTPQSPPPTIPLAAPPDLRELVAQARRHAPGLHIARIVVPHDERAPFHVLFSDRQPTPAGTPDLTSVYLDQHTGALLAGPPRTSRSAGDTAMAWLAPLHVGNFGGPGVRLLWAGLGLAPPVLFVTGFIMWWSRVVRPRRLSARARVRAPAAWSEP